jgi:CRP-like cAMP-binding protein
MLAPSSGTLRDRSHNAASVRNARSRDTKTRDEERRARRSSIPRKGRATPESLQQLSMRKERRFVPATDSWLLDGLDEGERKLAAGILRSCAALRLAAGARRHLGDVENAAALVVESGFLVVRASPPSGRHVVVAEAGESSILVPLAAREHLQALTDCWITVLPVPQLEGLLAIPDAAATLFRGLGSALRHRQDAASYIASVHHIDRVRQKLAQLAREFGRVRPDGVRIEFPLTHDLLAEMVASARETVTRGLDELQRSGFVARDGHSYKLLIPPEALDRAE